MSMRTGYTAELRADRRGGTDEFWRRPGGETELGRAQIAHGIGIKRAGFFTQMGRIFQKPEFQGCNTVASYSVGDGSSRQGPLEAHAQAGAIRTRSNATLCHRGRGAVSGY